MEGRYLSAASRASQAASYIRPEILAIPVARLKQFVAEKVMTPYRLIMERIVRYKPHTLGRGRGETAGNADRNGRRSPIRPSISSTTRT